MWISRPDRYGIFSDPKVKEMLSRYIDVVRKRKYAKYLICKTIGADFSRSDLTETLWKKHSKLLDKFVEYQADLDESNGKPKNVINSFLDLKIFLALRMIQSCEFCERRCGVNRINGLKGYCNAGKNFSLYSAFPHLGEEPELVPSGTIFTGGCSIRCIHCQNWDISQWRRSGTSVSPELMALQVSELATKGCININMVGGDPTPMTWQWLQTMNHVMNNIATIWNSNSYYSEETAKLLAGFIDVYLLDFKYGNNDCAIEISDAPNYWEASTRNHLMAHQYGELIIRVLVLPGHNECCTRRILQWIKNNLGPATRVNLMFQYRPEWRAKERKELNRRLTRNEIEESKNIASDIGLTNLVH